VAWLLSLFVILAKAKSKAFSAWAQFLQILLATAIGTTVAALGSPLLFLPYLSRSEDPALYPIVALLTGAGGLLIAHAFTKEFEREAREKILLTTPLSPIGSALLGLVKVRGKAFPANKLKAPLTGQEVIAFNYVEEELVEEPLTEEELIEELEKERTLVGGGREGDGLAEEGGALEEGVGEPSRPGIRFFFRRDFGLRQESEDKRLQ